jgi:hypothetical protein
MLHRPTDRWAMSGTRRFLFVALPFVFVLVG